MEDIIIEPNKDKATYNTFKYNILIITEDSTKIVHLYAELLKTVYKDIRFRITPAGSYSKFFKKLKTSYTDEFTHCIVIYDSGANAEALEKIRSDLAKYVETYPEKAGNVRIFSPSSSEQVLFSFDKLDIEARIDSTKDFYTEYNQLRDILSGNSYNTEEFEEHLIEISTKAKNEKDISKGRSLRVGTIENAYEHMLKNLHSIQHINMIMIKRRIQFMLVQGLLLDGDRKRLQGMHSLIKIRIYSNELSCIIIVSHS